MIKNVPLLYDYVLLLRKDATLFDPLSHVLIQTRHDLATPLSPRNVPPDMQHEDLSYPENQIKKKKLEMVFSLIDLNGIFVTICKANL